MKQIKYLLVGFISLLVVFSCSIEEDIINTTIPPEQSDLCINEFMADNETTISDENGDYDDWLEIYNTGVEPIDLSGYSLSDDRNSLDLWQFPDNTIIAPGAFLLIWCDSELAQGDLHAGFKLSKDGEAIYLCSATGGMIDSYEFGEQQTDVSMGRQPDGSANWVPIPVPTPAASNVAPPEIEIFINEFMAKNESTIQDEVGEYDDWVEIYNKTSIPVDLSGFYLSDEPANPELWRFPENVTIPPNDFLLIWCDEDADQPGLHANFKLSGSGEDLYLIAPDGIEIIDNYLFGAQTDDVSEGRFPDGSDNWQFFDLPTPGSSNQ